MLKLDINLVFTIINILILYFVVRKFLFKPVQNILARRQEEIDRQYAEAKESQDKADELKRQYEATMAAVDVEKKNILSETDKKANEDYEKCVANARLEADKILEDAKKAADLEKQKRIKEAKEQIADLVIEAAAKISGTKQSESNDRMLYDQFIAETQK